METSSQQTGRRRRRGLVSGAAVAVMLGGCLLGCGGGKRDKAPGRLAPRTVPILEGVAVPNGFDLVDKMSEDYESAGVRLARHEYEGTGDLFTIRRFYREQMPLLGWTRTSDQNVKGRISMRFEKKYEECTVEIEKGGVFGRASIQVIVKPFNRNPSQPPARKMP